ncbi:MAG: hypothetical protein CVU54_12160 [Deltaproteobacteria bacterium HGW-Deltaproteobacteria-12]|jgi:hypothetical protein|nr:MAG: hypothetical protein CVU54_12160 [Deltaproteobacteria bacterium HGW-Deltaproteobacteria-12]
MSYDEHDAAMDEFYDQMDKELYPEHREQAISEFTEERLRSFYIKSSFVMRPAVDSLQLGKTLLHLEQETPALVFFVSAIELLLKSALLKPVVYGLVHHEPMADIIVKYALGQSGFARYEGLLSDLFWNLAKINIKDIKRERSVQRLLDECKKLQDVRNNIIHKGDTCSKPDAVMAMEVSVAVFDLIVRPMLHSLGLTVIERGEIVPVQPSGVANRR